VAHTRTSRRWLRAACVAAGMAVALPDARQSWTEMREARRLRAADDGTTLDGARFDGTALDGTPVATENLAQSVLGDLEDTLTPPVTAGTVVRGAVVVAVGIGSVVGAIAFERWLFRRGETRAATGVRFAHTRTGLVLGALTAAGALLPDQSEHA